MNKSLVGRCGLYCGACGIYRAEKDNDESRDRIAKNSNCTRDEVRCNGCGDLTSQCWGNGCKIVVCQRSKGLDYCYECSEFQNNGCSKYDGLAKSYLEAGVDLRANLDKIRNGQTEEWLNESELKYTCPTCHKPVSVWNKTCKCGQKLK